MIKLIIFDLDGILVKTKDLHFEALNRALIDFHYEPIPYKDHINKFDGLPTREKLINLKVPDNLHAAINKQKQAYTMHILSKNIIADPSLVHLFRTLKEKNFSLHVASNSIRVTIETVLKNLDIIKFVDFIISNEEVKAGKPHPEMYLKCMIQAGAGPRETMIIEDSYVGRLGAFNSGAYISNIKNKDEVNLLNILTDINKLDGVKPMWKSNDLNIIIPMAGAGSRFAAAGYTFPKPLIDVHGKPMIQVVVQSLNIEANYIYVVRKEHYDSYNIKYMLEMLTPNCEIILVDGLTDGAACTILLAKEHIDNDKPLLIANSDQYIEWDSSHFMYNVQNGNIDGCVPVFFNAHPKWSYAKIDEDGWIIEIKEKQVVSNLATVGLYYWKYGSDFVKYAERMIEKDNRVNGEFYTAPVYSEAISDGKKFKTYKINEMLGLGTPEDLNCFLMKTRV